MPPRAEPPLRKGVIIFVVIGLAVAIWFRMSRTVVQDRGYTAQDLLTNGLAQIKQAEENAAQTFWGPELLAEKYGRAIDQLWDSLNRASNRLALLTNVAARITISGYQPARLFPHGIQVFSTNSTAHALAAADWNSFLQRQIASSWELAQCEFRQIAFRPGNGSSSPASTYYFSAHLLNKAAENRAILEGSLELNWSGTPDQPTIGAVNATALQVRTRAGPPAFREALNEEVKPIEGSYYIDPLIVWDLDHDGTPEIILADKNSVYYRGTNGVWTPRQLCVENPRIMFMGVLGDFDGNGTTDFLVSKFEGLFLYEGTADGRFPAPARQVWTAQPHLKFVEAMALGDVDGDGDLDVFLGQYKVPFDRGQMPAPYFDANDGYPSFLLLNDGKGNFSDATQKSGLGPKRRRRVYSASLADLDADGDLDLVVASDFAGLDCYANDGTGNFTDVSEKWFHETRAFGMGHTFADFNRDGRMDLLLIGMNSPAADRLASLGLERPFEYPDAGMRAQVTFGNRLYLGNGGGFAQTGFGANAARTGWSWGAAAEDLDNDGWPDLYITNGHESRESVREYEPEFWLHDLYVANSQDNPLALVYFRDKFLGTRAKGFSYGGYEKNRLYLNLGGTNLLECAWLFGVALEADSRNVLAEDLNGDGRLDLVLTTFETWPTQRQTLRIFENQLPAAERIITAIAPKISQIGKSIRFGNGPAHLLNTTDSFRSQHAPRVHLLESAVTEKTIEDAELVREPGPNNRGSLDAPKPLR